MGQEEAPCSSFREYARERRRQLGDAELVVRVLAGEDLAYEILVTRHSPTVLGFLSSRVALAADVEDLAQDVFLAAYRHLGSLRDAKRFGPWLVSIARNQLISYHRTVSRRRAAVAAAYGGDGRYSPHALQDLSPGPEAQASSEQTKRVVLEEIARMKERYREVLFPRLVGEETTVDIALRLGLTADTVRMRLMRGMRKLRKALRKHGLHDRNSLRVGLDEHRGMEP